MSRNHNLKTHKEGHSGFLSRILGFLIVFGVIFGFKYVKALLFPDKQALFAKEIYDWEQQNRGKDTWSFLSEEPTTTGKFRPYEIAIRKARNLETKFFNRYSDSIISCEKALDSIPSNLKIKMEKCYYLSMEIKNILPNHEQKMKSLFESLEHREFFTKEITINSQRDMEVYDKLSYLFYILATSNYKVENNQILFFNEHEMNNFNNYMKDFLDIYSKYQKEHERRLASLKENSQQVKVEAGDVALATAITLFGRRARTRR